MSDRIIKLGLILLILTIPFLTKGQSTKKIIEDAWCYLDTFENFKGNKNIELVKSWQNEQFFCVVSFEKGLFTLDGKTNDQREKGSWRIEETGGTIFLVISNDSGLLYRFEVMSVDQKKLKLKRLK